MWKTNVFILHNKYLFNITSFLVNAPNSLVNMNCMHGTVKFSHTTHNHVSGYGLIGSHLYNIDIIDFN